MTRAEELVQVWQNKPAPWRITESADRLWGEVCAAIDALPESERPRLRAMLESKPPSQERNPAPGLTPVLDNPAIIPPKSRDNPAPPPAYTGKRRGRPPKIRVDAAPAAG